VDASKKKSLKLKESTDFQPIYLPKQTPARRMEKNETAVFVATHHHEEFDCFPLYDNYTR
jgi:hypothetical protein